jgi:serine/threonine protein kinase
MMPPPTQTPVKRSNSNNKPMRNIHDYYAIENDPIGEGVCGKVYKAIENKTGKIWAVKVVKLKNANMQSTQDVLREAEIMTEIGEHPNIIHLKEVHPPPPFIM